MTFWRALPSAPHPRPARDAPNPTHLTKSMNYKWSSQQALWTEFPVFRFGRQKLSQEGLNFRSACLWLCEAAAPCADPGHSVAGIVF